MTKVVNKYAAIIVVIAAMAVVLSAQLTMGRNTPQPQDASAKVTAFLACEPVAGNGRITLFCMLINEKSVDVKLANPSRWGYFQVFGKTSSMTDWKPVSTMMASQPRPSSIQGLDTLHPHGIVGVRYEIDIKDQATAQWLRSATKGSVAFKAHLWSVSPGGAVDPDIWVGSAESNVVHVQIKPRTLGF